MSRRLPLYLAIVIIATTMDHDPPWYFAIPLFMVGYALIDYATRRLPA